MSETSKILAFFKNMNCFGSLDVGTPSSSAMIFKHLSGY